MATYWFGFVVGCTAMTAVFVLFVLPQAAGGAGAATSTPNRKLPTGVSVAGKPPIVLPEMVPSTNPQH